MKTNTLAQTLSLFAIRATPIICLFAASQFYTHTKKLESKHPNTHTTNRNSSTDTTDSNPASWPNYAI